MKKQWLSALTAALLCLSASIPAAAEPGYGCEYLSGDLNGDGEVGLSDVAALYLFLHGYYQDFLHGYYQDAPYTFYDAADINFDGKVNVFDLALLEMTVYQNQLTYSSLTLRSPDVGGEVYTVKCNLATDRKQKTTVTADWYDPDGDLEKTDTFTMYGTEPLTPDWGEAALTITCPDKETSSQDIVLSYPDRTKTIQSVTKAVDRTEDPEVVNVTVSAESYNDLNKKVSITKSGYIYLHNSPARVGTPILLKTDDSIGECTVTIQYDPEELRWIPEENLCVYVHKEDNSLQESGLVAFTADDDANTITFTIADDCSFMLVDGYLWYLDKSDTSAASPYAYDTPDITQYVSDWEREGDCGDIMTLADKEWVRDNFDGQTFTVSNAQELASAVYYCNAIQTLQGTNRMLLFSSNITIRLTEDIDLNGYDWKPITAFSGTLDGGGHTISGMTLHAQHAGFFGSTCKAEVKDIFFADAAITVSGYGHAGIVSADESANASFCNVHVQGRITSDGNAKCGGIAMNGETFTDCTADVTVNGERRTALSYGEYLAQERLDNGEELIQLTADLSSMTITRTSDASITDYTLCILRDDSVLPILSRGFADEVLDMNEIYDYLLTPGSYRLYVTAYRNGQYERISNIVSYDVDVNPTA